MADPNAPAAPAAPATPPAALAAQAEDKATEKAKADAVVATDPHATHSVKLAVTSPKVMTGTGTGALIGLAVGGPPGAAIGAGIGFLTERYQIAGGPIGKVYDKITGLFHKKK
jgi:hypothetical protein